MFCMRNKKNNIELHNLIWRSDLTTSQPETKYFVPLEKVPVRFYNPTFEIVQDFKILYIQSTSSFATSKQYWYNVINEYFLKN